jgi:hypothetical protein
MYNGPKRHPQGHHLVLQDDPEAGESESSGSEDHGETLEGTYARGCDSLDEARMTGGAG